MISGVLPSSLVERRSRWKRTGTDVFVLLRCRGYRQEVGRGLEVLRSVLAGGNLRHY